MSSDDGWIIRQNDKDKYVLQHYFASGDHLPPIDESRALVFDSLEEATRKYAELDGTDYPSEYGLIVRVKERVKMEIEKYVRREFPVDVVRVTEDNMEEAAKWCGGAVVIEPSGRKFIQVNVHNPMNERQTRAYIGDRVLWAGRGHKVYTENAFNQSFVKKSDETDSVLTTDQEQIDFPPNQVENNVFDQNESEPVV